MAQQLRVPPLDIPQDSRNRTKKIYTRCVVLTLITINILAALLAYTVRDSRPILAWEGIAFWVFLLIWTTQYARKHEHHIQIAWELISSSLVTGGGIFMLLSVWNTNHTGVQTFALFMIAIGPIVFISHEWKRARLRHKRRRRHLRVVD